MWDSDAAYDNFMGRFSSRLAPVFADFAGVEAGDRVLDVGAGTGMLTHELVRRGALPAAIDPAPAFAETLHRRFPDLDVREGPAESLPWEDGSFDAALAQLVVVFLNDVPRAVRELIRVTRPGGVVATTMWEFEGVEMMNALNEIRRQLAPGGFQPSTEYRDEASLRKLFEEAGLRDVVGRRLSRRDVLDAEASDQLLGQGTGARADVERALRRSHAGEVREGRRELRRVAPHETVIGVPGPAEDRPGHGCGVTATAKARAFKSKGPLGLPSSRNSSSRARSRVSSSSEATHCPAGPTPRPIACQNSSKSR